MNVYEKATGILRWLLGSVVLRELLASVSHCALPGCQSLPPEINCNLGSAVGISENFDQ